MLNVRTSTLMILRVWILVNLQPLGILVIGSWAAVLLRHQKQKRVCQRGVSLIRRGVECVVWSVECVVCVLERRSGRGEGAWVVVCLSLFVVGGWWWCRVAWCVEKEISYGQKGKSFA